MITRGLATNSIITRGFLSFFEPYISNTICTFSRTVAEYVFSRVKQIVVFKR